jgi:hypothetical protein
LALNISLQNGKRRSTCRHQAKTLAPKIFFPKLLTNLWELLFEQSAAGTFIGIDELADFAFWMSAKQHMRMIQVVIPFLKRDFILWGDIRENFLSTRRNLFVKNPAPIFYDKHEVIMQQKDRMSITIQFHGTTVLVLSRLNYIMEREIVKTVALRVIGNSSRRLLEAGVFLPIH